MNIVCSLPGPAGAWKRAASWLGHTLEEIDPKRPLDAFQRIKPDVVLIDHPWVSVASVRRWLDSFAGKIAFLYRPGMEAAPGRYDLFMAEGINGDPWGLRLKPALDAYPDTPPGSFRPEFACDIVYVGTHTSEIDPVLNAFCELDLSFKIFGDGHFTQPSYLGSVAPSDVSDIYASAKVSLDLLGEPSRVLAINAAGGTCLTAKPYENTGIPKLDETPGSANLCVLVEQARLLAKNASGGVTYSSEKVSMKRVLQDTFVDRLKEILERLKQERVHV